MDGILVVAKPIGPTSHDVVASSGASPATRRVGHGGTLDPFAAGVLPVFLGRATRLVEYHLGDEKALPRDGLLRGDVHDGRPRWRADARSTGRPPTAGAVEAALAAFRGPIEQRPPVYSAIQIGGRHAYDLARAARRRSCAARR